MRRVPADFLLLATVALWSLNFTVSKYILEHGFRPLSYSAVRYATAAAVFIAVTLLRERSLRISRPQLWLAGSCVVVLFLNQLCFIYALDFTNASTVALLFGTLPIWTALLARGTGVESQTLRFWGAASLSVAGVALVALGAGGALSTGLKGDALALGGAATWAAYSVALAPLMRRYSPFRLSAVFLPCASLLLFAVGTPQVSDQAWDLGWLVWVGFAFAVLGPLVTTNVLWFTAIDRVGPSRASLFANLQPFLAAIVAVIVLSEDIARLQVAGGVALAGGIVLAPRTSPPLPDAD